MKRKIIEKKIIKEGEDIVKRGERLSKKLTKDYERWEKKVNKFSLILRQAKEKLNESK